MNITLLQLLKIVFWFVVLMLFYGVTMILLSD